jgi:hypothetical protein
MACTIATGKERYCKVQPGGLETAYIINRFDDNHATGLATTDGVLDATSGVSAAAAGTYFQFDLDPYLSNLNQTIVVNNGGGVGFQQDLELVFRGVYGKADVTMANLTNGTWQIVVADNSGTLYFLGLENGLICTGGSFGHGGDVALSDNQEYRLQFQSIETSAAVNCGALANFSGQTNVTISASQLDGS